MSAWTTGVALAAVCAIAAPVGHASSHREAPITAFDHKADITDIYAFRSYDGGATPRVTLILCVDPLLEPGNGPNWFPYRSRHPLRDQDRQQQRRRRGRHVPVPVLDRNSACRDLFQAYAGAGDGFNAPANSPAPVPPGTPIVPPKITSFDSAGLGQRQSYTVTMVKGGVSTPLGNGGPLYAVPANVGPRTMDYDALFNSAIYDVGTNMRVFAGTTDDPFWIDLGASFDTLNLRSSVAPGILTPAQDAAYQNFASDTVSGYSVNSIAIEVPVSLLTRTGQIEAATSTAATIGVWATTSRPRSTVRRAPLPAVSSGTPSQVQRFGNALINELLIGTGYKDRFSMDQPKNDSQFASFFLDPTLPRVINALTNGALPIPAAPRNDLLPLVTYAAPIAAANTPPGPIADLMRLNTGVAPTPPGVGFTAWLVGRRRRGLSERPSSG